MAWRRANRQGRDCILAAPCKPRVISELLWIFRRFRTLKRRSERDQKDTLIPGLTFKLKSCKKHSV